MSIINSLERSKPLWHSNLKVKWSLKTKRMKSFDGGQQIFFKTIK